MRYTRNIFCLFLLVCGFWAAGSGNAFALSCKTGADYQSGSTKKVVSLDHAIEVSTGSLQAGQLLWRSEPITVTFTCYDTDQHPSGENAYFYWDPKSQVQNISPSLSVGVTYEGVDHAANASQRTLLGRATGPGVSQANCVSLFGSNIFNWNAQARQVGCADPQTFTLTFSVFIKATGQPPPSSGVIGDNGEYSLFQMDGVGGLNESRPNANYNLYLSGLANIRFVSCNPVVSIEGNSGNTVDFGKISVQRASAGKVEKRLPFSVVASLDDNGTGQDCQGRTLVASFSTNNDVQSNNTIIATNDETGSSAGVGIQIFTQSDPDTPLQMKHVVEVGTADGTVVKTTFDAGLIWLTNFPVVGPFSAMATVDVTFQ